MLTREIRKGDDVVCPSGRVARVLDVTAEYGYLRLRYLDADIVTAKDESENELTLAERYCRLLKGWNGRPRGRPPKL